MIVVIDMGKVLPLSDRLTKTFTTSRPIRRYLIVFAVAILLVVIALTAGRHYLLVPVSPGNGTNSDAGDSDEITTVREATYYVDSNNGNDDYDGRTTDTPFKTIHKAASIVQPSDVVHIREGVYYLSSSLRLTTYGTSDSPIVFEGYPGEEVILSGGMVYLTASWNTLANLQVTGSSQQGIYVFGNNNVFENIVTYDNYMSGLQIAEGDRNLLINVISHGNYGGEHTDGIGISSGYQNTLKGCVVYDNSDDGVDTWESSNNTIENCIAYSNGYNGGDGNGFKVGPGVWNIVTRCIAYSNSFNGFDTNEGADNDIYNNTAYNNGRYNFTSYYYQNTLRNNISYSGGLLMADGPIQSHNTWNLGIYDPGFLSLDPSSPDFLSLSSNSAARNAGESGVDLGAMQYGQTVADLTPAF
jgi:parallel beta-helix repeat protein